MGAIIAGLIGLIWANIAIALVIVSFFGGELLAALVFLALVFATPFVLDKATDMV
jgi:hypothetical protein